MNFQIIAAVKASAKKQKTPYVAPNNRNLLTVLSGDSARAALLQPDNRMQFRVRTFHDDVRIQSVEIHSGNWKPEIPKPEAMPGAAPSTPPAAQAPY